MHTYTGGFPLRSDPSQYEPIRKVLVKELGLEELAAQSTVTVTALQTTVQEIMNFMETNFGQRSRGPFARKWTKIPVELFYDFRINGFLHRVLSICYKFKEERSFRKLDFSSEMKQDQNIELFEKIFNTLKKEQYLKFPIVWFELGYDQMQPDDQIIQEQQYLSGIVLRHGGSLAQYKEMASHVVHSDPTQNPQQYQEHLARIVAKDLTTKNVLVHWWYTPDSYDQWLPQSEVKTEKTPLASQQGQRHVTTQWLMDLENFNEWMNDLDYNYYLALELSRSSRGEPETKPSALRSSMFSLQRRQVLVQEEKPTMECDGTTISTGDENAPPAKRLKTQHPTNTPPAVVPKSVETEPRTTASLEKYQRNSTITTGVSDAPLHITNISTAYGVVTPIKPFSSGRPNPPITLALPTHTTWFDISTISSVEKESLPEFFDMKSLSKTPVIYKEYRDFMIMAYHQNPQVYLTVTACRRNLAGDACAIIRVHDFLSHWGLINYKINIDRGIAGSVTDSSGGNGGNASSGSGSGGASLFPPPTLPPPSGGTLDQLFGGFEPGTGGATNDGSDAPLKEAQLSCSSKLVFSGCADHEIPKIMRPRLNPDEALFTPGKPADGTEHTPSSGTQFPEKIKSTLTPIICHVTKKPIVGGVYYKSLKHPNIYLSPMAFAQGKFGPDMFSSDFQRVDDDAFVQEQLEYSEVPNSSSYWTPEETLLLLEGIQMYADDWEAVAKHVESKNPAECLHHFIRLPIEDPFLVDLQLLDSSLPSVLSSLKVTPIPCTSTFPFSTTKNPIMSLVSFLSSMVSTDVAAASAQGALKKLTEIHEEKDSNIKPDPHGTASNGANSGNVFNMDEVREACGAALKAAAAKARVLAQKSEHDIEATVLQLVEVMSKKIEYKMKRLDLLENALKLEHEKTELSLRTLVTEQVRLEDLQRGVGDNWQRQPQPAQQLQSQQPAQLPQGQHFQQPNQSQQPHQIQQQLLQMQHQQNQQLQQLQQLQQQQSGFSNFRI